MAFLPSNLSKSSEAVNYFFFFFFQLSRYKLDFDEFFLSEIKENAVSFL